MKTEAWTLLSISSPESMRERLWHNQKLVRNSIESQLQLKG